MRRLPVLLLVGMVLGCSTTAQVEPNDSVSDSAHDGVLADALSDLISDLAPMDKPEPWDLDSYSDQDSVPDTPDLLPDELGGPVCGDGVCGEGETCELCPDDCGPCVVECGDGQCHESEDCAGCPADCGACPAECGNSVCEAGEGCAACPGDCGECPVGCGDSVCDSESENCTLCPEDCGACPNKCGDTVCDVGETCTSCPGDCGACQPYCGDGHVNTADEECDDGGHVNGDGCDENCKSEAVVQPGVVLITEIMKNPSMTDDTMGEWIELYNTTDTAIDLNGWTIRDGGNDNHVITAAAPLMIQPHGFFVLGRNGQPSTNGGLSVDYVYTNFNLSNKDDEILLVSADNQEVDRVAYDDGVSFPDEVGSSLSLDPKYFELEANDSGEAWCDGAEAYGLGDFGTPGAMNPSCPVPVGCPNEICDPGETCMGCPEDCGACPVICGDGLCVPGEGCQGCPSDCGVCPMYCGDHTCNNNETCVSCPQDCGYCCGNHLCDNEEDCKSCPGDCGNCCGDGECTALYDENCANCPSDCGSCSSCGNGQCDLGEDCGICWIDCGACGVCGDAECTPDESCDTCPGDCGFCAPTGWCNVYGLSGSSVTCQIRVAADSPVSPLATGMQFDLLFDTTLVSLDHLADTYCVGSTCIPWNIPPQTTLQPSGHTVVSEVLTGQGQRIMMYHGADATKTLNSAYLSGYYLIGDAAVVDVVFKLKATVPLMFPVKVKIVEARGTDAGSNPLAVVQASDGLLVTSPNGYPTCGDGQCTADEGCLLCSLDCGECPEPCGDGICLGGEACETCPADCGKCPAVCGDSLCEAGEEDCSSCKVDCGACPPACGDLECNGEETCSTCPGDCGICPPVCGDAECNGTEGCKTCPLDCGICPAVCDNGSCEPQESCLSCPEDCGICQEPCGDGTCGETETCSSCLEDCGVCPCGNGVCTYPENCATCPLDCGSCPGCPDGICNGVESCLSCPQDCGICPCGDGVCAADETCADCQMDCGPCPWCGDTVCNGEETCDTCVGDCGLCPCGDGVCALDEDCETCAEDCGACPSCGDGVCNGLETCDTCAGDCGDCPPVGWCQIYGAGASLFYCAINVAAADATSSPAAGIQFVVNYDKTKVNLIGFHDQLCSGDVCVDWDIPPQSSLQPTGHTLVFDDVLAGQKRVLIYHGSLPETPLSAAYRSGGVVVGEPEVVVLMFRLLTDVPASAPSAVTLEDRHATDKDAQPLSMVMSGDGVLITSEL